MHPPPAHRLAALGLIGAIGLFSLYSPASSAPTGPLLDPTRPPGAAATTSATGNRPGRTSGAKPGSTTPPLEPSVALSSVQLQGIQTSSRQPPSAMVDGQLVKVGDSVAGRTVLAIDSQGLLLRGQSGHERLWLLTDSPKQTAGSITTTRSAAYQPASSAPDGAADADALQRADRTPGRSPNTATPAGNAAALSLVGRTTP